MKPASRPITSHTMMRSWLSAVVCSLSSASTTVLTAVSKPNELIVQGTSLSIVLGTQTTCIPFSTSCLAMRSEPSPPMLTIASMPRARARSTSSSERST
jgi:hypothetical protein